MATTEPTASSTAGRASRATPLRTSSSACPRSPAILRGPVPGPLADLLGAIDDILALDDPAAILRKAVEVAREKIGLSRAAIFLADESRKMMVGTWGSDLRGAVVDEHRIM